MKRLRIVPLGGVGEIGRNCLVLEGDSSLIVIDCGVEFLTDNFNEFLVPDISYILERKEKVKGILLTHAHEDHIGAVPYLLSHINVPIYASDFTINLLKERLSEFGITDIPLRVVSPNQRVEFGEFSVEFIRMSHSIIGMLGMLVSTDIARLFITGDFKIDYPGYTEGMDFYRIAKMGEDGVDILLSESTNILSEGFSGTEIDVKKSLSDIFLKTRGKVLVATFSSNIPRIQQVIDLSLTYGRKVTVIGTSLKKNMHLALENGYLKLNEDWYVSPERIRDYEDSEITVILTGTQGEPMSYLYRIAFKKQDLIKLSPNDSIIITASIIPGNETPVYQMINSLVRYGVEVFYEGLLNIHTSGHAHYEELRLLVGMIKPKFFIPIHGEYRHLVKHKKMVEENFAGIQTFLMEDGDVIIYDNKRGIRRERRLSLESIYWDGKNVVKESTMKKRRELFSSGVVSVSLGLDLDERKIVYPPMIKMYGVLDLSVEERIKEEISEVVKNTVSIYFERDVVEIPAMRRKIEDKVKQYIRREIKRKPVILVSLLVND